MERNKRQRSVYVSARQKKKLIELVTKHPELISCKVTQDFNYSDSRRLWIAIASECNSIPGARKSWKQWRKTWQDLRSNTKKRHAEANRELPSSVVLLTPAEQEALGIKDVSSISTCLDGPADGDHQRTFNNGNTNVSFSDESESTPEDKVFRFPIENNISNISDNHGTTDNVHSSTCVFNCNMLAKQELKKINIKEDYLNFKKDYLRQKLKLLKEQTDALKSIAKELCTK